MSTPMSFSHTGIAFHTRPRGRPEEKLSSMTTASRFERTARLRLSQVLRRSDMKDGSEPGRGRRRRRRQQRERRTDADHEIRVDRGIVAPLLDGLSQLLRVLDLLERLVAHGLDSQDIGKEE